MSKSETLIFLKYIGYEWTCPYCRHVNTEEEKTETVNCFKCWTEYEVG